MGNGLLKSSNILISFTGRGRGGEATTGEVIGFLEALAMRRGKRRFEVSSNGILTLLFSKISVFSDVASKGSNGDGVLGPVSSASRW